MIPRSPSLLRRHARSAALFVAAWLVAACGFVETTPPAPTPADFGGIEGQLRAVGISVDNIRSGDAGCPNEDLARTAISMKVSGLDQAAPVPVYLYIFRNRDAFERRRTDVDTCARSYVTDPNTFESIEASPYVLAGQGPWAPKFGAALRSALTAAAGTGG